MYLHICLQKVFAVQLLGKGGGYFSPLRRFHVGLCFSRKQPNRLSSLYIQFCNNVFQYIWYKKSIFKRTVSTAHRVYFNFRTHTNCTYSEKLPPLLCICKFNNFKKSFHQRISLNSSRLSWKV